MLLWLGQTHTQTHLHVVWTQLGYHGVSLGHLPMASPSPAPHPLSCCPQCLGRKALLGGDVMKAASVGAVVDRDRLFKQFLMAGDGTSLHGKSSWLGVVYGIL